ncbi:MAG: type IV toxin-antitoxin system AbiEi family antitoxin [Hespellia sp.]|nr:type IV toxin-antitoxin system AbiEi family antitoxin [Hespellia sp.]
MKQQEVIEKFKQLILRIPIVEKCDLKNKTEHSTVFEIEIQDGYEFIATLHFVKNGFPKQIQSQGEQITGEGYHLIAAPYISEASEDICDRFNLGYIDVAGNCKFQYHSLFVHVTGNKNTEIQKRALKSIFERSSVVSSKILRFMVQDSQRTWRMKEIAEACSCSIGQVSKVKDFLMNHAWIEQNQDGIQLIEIEKMLKEWSQIYGNRENETVEAYTLENIPAFETRLRQMKTECGIDYYLTGFAGGVRYQPVVRYKRVHCYIQSEDMQEALDYLQLKKVDSGSNVFLIVPYNECVLENSRQIQGSQVVSPVQIYLDCRGLKGRGEEIADAIMTKEIIV